MEEKPLSYFALSSLQTVFADVQSSKKGLTQKEATKRLKTYGPNRIAEKQELSIVLEFLSHFKSPLIIILLIAGTISACFGEVVDAFMIAGMVLMSGILDFVEEHSANEAAKKLQKRVQIFSSVYRDHKLVQVLTADLVPGDVVFLRAGSIVPSDARLIESDDFFVDQSALTGESLPCEKYADAAIEKEVVPIESPNMVFHGSNVISGTASALLVKTGSKTEFGKIAESLTNKASKSGFEVGVTQFGMFIMKVILFLVVFIFFLNSLIHHDVLQSFLFAVAVAVGVTPELLPVIMSVTMARGSVRMAKAGVIVKKLSAIPSFGSMNILCTDKTGTLTEGKVELVSCVDAFGKESTQVFELAYVNSSFQTGMENLLDQAVLKYKKLDVKAYTKKEEIPFDFHRRIMSVVVQKGKDATLIAKGAPEEILSRCASVASAKMDVALTVAKKQMVNDTIEQLSKEGYRILAIGSKHIKQQKKQYTTEDERELTLVGFVAFLDPAKTDVHKTIVDLERLGIEIKIISGDHVLVTKKICKDIGLTVRGTLDGATIQNWSDQKLKEAALKTTIFARFSPEQKQRVIEVLRSGDDVVGYLGDGINDAPSLRAADVGVSVNNAVDIAKATADIVITKKSLEILVEGVVEGRKTFGNTMKYIMMGLSSNFGNMFSVLGAIFFLPFLPMLPIQILLNNFIYDVSQVTLPTDNMDEEWLQKPRHWDMSFIRKFMLLFGPISSFYDITTFLVLYYGLHLSGSVFQTGWFVESLATQTLVIHIIRTKKIPFIQSRPSLALLISTFTAVAIGWIIPFTPIGAFFKFEALPVSALLLIALIVAAYLLSVEVAKRLFFRKFVNNY